MDEVVALFDADGRRIGSAARSRVRAENLRHGGTAVIVRNSLGLVYVHRRTDTKDVFPGLYDFCAGGVLLAGEDPLEGATREVAEELGVTGVDLVPLLRASYHDDFTTYEAFGYAVTYDGPITWQSAEVASGEWMEMSDLARRLDDPAWPFVPDSATLVGDWIRERAADRQPIEDGWDSSATLVERTWIDRVPRRPDVVAPLLAETQLMPLIGPRLPLAVPRPEVISADPLTVRHIIVAGQGADPGLLGAAHGRQVGEFLRSLHAIDVADVSTALASRTGERESQQTAMRTQVLPRLEADDRARGAELLDAIAVAPATTLIHGDLGPEHLLIEGGAVVGVIDWTDARIGDPALDLAWVLHGTSTAFAAAVTSSYAPSAETIARAHLWHRLGPWHEVLHGLDNARPDYVESGLAGVRARL